MLFRINNLGYYAVCPLTTNIDNFVGESLDVEFTGVTGAGATLNTGDTLTGGPGASTFNITGNGGAAAIVETSGVQTVNVRAVTDTEINQVLMSGVTSATSSNSLGNVDFTNAQLATTFSLNNTNNIVGDTANLSVVYQAAAGTADKALISINNAGGKVGADTVTQTINTTAASGDIEAISLATAGTNFVTLAGGAKVASVTVSGSGTNTVTLTDAATALTLDASASTGTNTLVINNNLSTTDTIVGGSGKDTLRGNVSTATQMVPSVTDVETLDLTFAAAGIFNAANVSGATKLIVTNTAAATFTNVSDDVVDIQIGKTAAITGAGLTVGYASGSVSDVKLTVGATPTTGTTAVSTGAVVMTGNKAGFTVESVGSTKNTVGAMTVDAVTSLSLVGKSQALDVGAVSAKAATALTVDATAKNVTQTGAVTVDDSLSTLTVTSGSGTATIGAIGQTGGAGKSIDTTYNFVGGAKALTAGAVSALVANAAGNDINAVVNVSGAAGVVSVGALSFLGAADAESGDTTNVSLTATGTAATGTVTVAGLTVAEGGTSASSTTVELNGLGGDVTLTNLALTDSDTNNITMTADGSDVTITTLTNTTSTTTNIVVSAATGDAATITNLAGTSNLNSITASGAGTISLFATASTAVTGDAVIDATGTTGNFTLNLSSAAGNLNVLLGNAASGNKNIVSTGAGADVIIGGSGADSINGGAAEDVITGGAGNDTIIGGLAADNLTGGLGADTFVFTSALTADSITDFTVSQSDILSFGKADLSLAGAAGAVTAATAATVAALAGAGSGDQYVIVDTLANIAAFTNAGGQFSGPTVAIATDVGLVLWDANGNFVTGSVSIGEINSTQAALIVSANLAFIA